MKKPAEPKEFTVQFTAGTSRDELAACLNAIYFVQREDCQSCFKAHESLSHRSNDSNLCTVGLFDVSQPGVVIPLSFVLASPSAFCFQRSKRSFCCIEFDCKSAAELLVEAWKEYGMEVFGSFMLHVVKILCNVRDVHRNSTER